jgi:hypothetical protein
MLLQELEAREAARLQRGQHTVGAEHAAVDAHADRHERVALRTTACEHVQGAVAAQHAAHDRRRDRCGGGGYGGVAESRQPPRQRLRGPALPAMVNDTGHRTGLHRRREQVADAVALHRLARSAVPTNERTLWLPRVQRRRLGVGPSQREPVNGVCVATGVTGHVHGDAALAEYVPHCTHGGGVHLHITAHVACRQ